MTEANTSSGGHNTKKPKTLFRAKTEKPKLKRGRGSGMPSALSREQFHFQSLLLGE